MERSAGKRGLPLPLLVLLLGLPLPILGACTAASPLVVEEKEPAPDEFKDLFEAAKNDPKSHELQARLGFHFYRYERDFNRARVHYERAIELAGRRKFTGYHYVLGVIYWEMKEYDEALVELEDTFRVPQKPGATTREDAYYRQSQWLAAKIYAENKKDPEKAIEHVARYHDIGGSLNMQTEIYLAITQVYLEKEDIENATVNLQKFKDLASEKDKGEIWSLERALKKLKDEKEGGEQAAEVEKKKEKDGEKEETPNSAKIGPKGDAE